MRRDRARSRRGNRVSITIPTIRGRMQTLIIAANQDKILHQKLISETTCSGEQFTIFIQELIINLNANNNFRGSWLIMINAQIHKVRSARDFIGNSGYHLAFLSPYSYMLNPVENIFSKIKSLVRGTMDRNLELVMK